MDRKHIEQNQMRGNYFYAYNPEEVLSLSELRTQNWMVVAEDDLVERALVIALIVLGVVLQQPPIRQAPSSHHFPTYDTKSSSATPADCCNRKVHNILTCSQFHGMHPHENQINISKTKELYPRLIF